jgi:inorganic pyrophosphatase
MTNFQKLPTWADGKEGKQLHAVVETPRGSAAKLKFDPKLKAFTLAKPLLVGLTYPYDWGFVPATRAEDGDPVDALIIHDAGTYPGLVLTCRPIGLLEIVQVSKKGRARNDRVFLIPVKTDFEADLQDVRNFSNRMKQELQKFFEATDALDDKQLDFLGWRGPKAALRLIGKHAV